MESKDKVVTLLGEQGIDGIGDTLREMVSRSIHISLPMPKLPMPMEGEKPAWEEDDKVLDDSDISWNVDNQDDDNKGGDDAHATSGVR